ncbi:hypothetical protein MBRA1_003937 [Malassezia brasiliensis]|uniref:Uncharacterized protein n=1 Tax=Malassezia brasiliensis TaxID=1821822 RepID=A0AAF0E1B4_9BASI|nr:hypothetical protein MBRA1_003937 [Malassezia brasiliensis]
MSTDAVGTSDREEATGVGSAEDADTPARMAAWRTARAPRAAGAHGGPAAGASDPAAGASDGAAAAGAPNGAAADARGAAAPAHAPSPPLRHNLRARKLAQIHPYTVEALQYRRELFRNDWQDAVVSQREWRHARRLDVARRSSASDGDDEGSASDGGSASDEGSAGDDEGSANASDDEGSASDEGSTSDGRAASSSSAAPRVSSPARTARSPSLGGPASSDTDAVPPAAVPARRKRRAPTPSSDDSTDYERRFRILKRMMPAHMARACIDDLRAMRHGHADDTDADDVSASPPRAASPRAASPTSPLRPGESRRRTGAPIDAHAPLLSDVDSASDTPPPTPSPPLADGDVRWWCEPRRAASPPTREADAVDRMLTRTSGARGFGQRTARRRRGTPRRRAPTHGDADGAWMWRVPRAARHAATPRGHRGAPRAASASTSASEASDDAARATGGGRRRGAAPLFLVAGDAERVRGVPTTRGDVQSYARLPYVQGAGRPASIDASNHAALVDVPMAVPSMAPKRVHRRAAAPRTGAGGTAGAASAAPVPGGTAGAASAAPASLPPFPPAWQHASLDTPLQHELQELLCFDTLANVSLDFGLRVPPVGVRFAAGTPLGRGRLHALLHTADDVGSDEAPACHVLGTTLHGHMAIGALERAVPPLLDAVWDALREGGVDAERGVRALDDLGDFLGAWLVWRARRAEAAAAATLGAALDADAAGDGADVGAQAARLTDLVYTLLERGAPATHGARVRLALLWLRVQLAFRVHALAPEPGTDAAVLDAAQPLVVHLLAAGVHKAMAHVAAAPADGLDDVPAALWVALVHVLDAVGHAFYDVLDAALDDWHAASPASPVVWAERVWYLVLATSVFARFGAAAGVVRAAPAAPPRWALVARALSLRLRFDARVEAAAPRALLARRDAYIRVVVTRCLVLAERFAWPLADAEAVLGRVFDVFDAHRLADLPSETDHDFAPFLRRYDAAWLHAAPDGTAYARFLQLLGRAGAALVGAGDARRAARLFSRMTPVRVMHFTRAAVPTRAERAVLFNHYSLVMLFLYLVPDGAVQRVRQLRSFLVFADADGASQVMCVRAMVYCATLFRHHRLPLAPVTAWFVEVCRAAAAQARAPHDDRSAARQHTDAVRVLLGVVRGVQHVVAHASLDAGAPPTYPPADLLHDAWTDELLDVDARVRAEVVRGLGAFWRARAAVEVVRAQPSTGGGVADPLDAAEFDDTFLADPQLAALLGEAPPPTPPPPPAWDAEADRRVVQAVHTRLSPALFRCVAQAPAPPAPGAAASAHAAVEALVADAERDVDAAELVACWAAWASVLVRAEARTWHSYLSLGAESWRRVAGDVHRRAVAVHLAVLVARLDPRGFADEVWEVVGIWFHTIAAPRATYQAELTARLAGIDSGGLFAGVDVAWSEADHAQDADAAAWDAVRPAPLAPAARAAAVARVLHNLDAACARHDPPFSLGYAIQCVSALLSSVRACIRP